MLTKAFFLLSFLYIISAQTSGDVSLPTNSFTLGTALTINYEFGDDNTITMAITCSLPNQFFAIGLGSTMTNVDIWTFEIVNNAVRVTDYWSTTETRPTSDANRGGQDDLETLGYEITAQYTIVKIKRALDTGDDFDLPIQLGDTDFIWATATTATMNYHQGQRGTARVTLVENPEQEDIVFGDVVLPGNTVNLGEFLVINYEINNTDASITMAIRCTIPNQFFGLGFGTSMTNSDIWVFEIVDSAVTATDYYSTGQEAPTQDTARQGGQENLELLGYQITSEYTLVKVKRALDTGDTNDKVLQVGSNSVIYATAASQTLAYHDGQRGIGVLDLVAPVEEPEPEPEEEEEETPVEEEETQEEEDIIVGDVSAPENSVSLGTFLTINYEMNSDNTAVTMLIKCSLPGQFFALGFGEGMRDSDVWLFELVNSEVVVGDYFSTGYDFPQKDEENSGQNDLERLGYEITSEYTLVKVRRALVTGDPRDKIIRVGTNDVIYATAGSPTVAYHDTGLNGYATITLIGNSSTNPGEEEEEEPVDEPGVVGDISLPENYFFVGSFLTINFEFTNDGSIILAFKCSSPNQFFGIGFGSVMTGTDMWVFEIVNSGTEVTATDYKGLTAGPPTLDTDIGGTQDLELLGYKITPSYTIVKVKRALDTGDPNDFVLYEGWVDMIYATAPTRFMSKHGTSQRGFATVPLIDGTQGFIVLDATSNTDDIHGILNLIAWGLLVDIGIIVVRILRGRRITFGNIVISAQMIHSAIMWLVFIISVTVTAVLLNKNRGNRGGKLTGEPLRDFHYINGAIMMLLSFLTVLIGVANMLYLKSYKQAPPTLVNVKKLHKYLGLLMYAGAKLNIIIGTIFHKDGAWKAPVFIYLGALIVVHMLIQKKYIDGFQFSKKSRHISQKPSKKPRHIALMHAINSGVPRERLLLEFPGIKWVQLGNRVYDVTDWTHPGGNFIIEACIGREVGRFIYGNYALESTHLKPHKHSPLALSQLKKFYIGEVNHGESVLVSKNSGQEIFANVTHEWTVASIKPVSDTVSQVNFQNKDFRVKNFGVSLTWLARHFTVGFANRKKKPSRLYTIAMSLNEANIDLRENLFKYFDAIMSGEPVSFEYDNSYLEPQDTLPLFIKNYSNVNGLSKAIHQVEYMQGECTFRVEGPIGRGLELTQMNSGTQTIICAGTGLFPFIDFLNFFLWKNMYELVKRKAGKAKAQEMNILNIPFENYMNGLRINFMGSFANEKDILGLDIIKKLAEISDKYELQNFNAMIRGYSDEYIVGVKESFTVEFFRKHVGLDEKRFYVVGPPKMNAKVSEGLKYLGIPEEKIVFV